MSGLAVGLILLALVVVLGLAVIVSYNRFVRQRNLVEESWRQIDVELHRRYDLIPNLVEVAKGYMKHERETLEGVITARNAAVSGLKNASANPSDAGSIKELAGAEAMLTGALGKLFALAEAYPDLKANQNMLALQEELSSTENKVAFSRQAFNDTVMSFNNARENFPNNLIANFFNFKPAELLEIETPEKRAVPDVSFT